MHWNKKMSSPILFYRQKFDDFKDTKAQQRATKAKSRIDYYSRSEAISISLEEETEQENAVGRIRYGAYRNGSTGAFNYKGMLNKKELGKLEDQLSKHEGLVWDGVFSLPDYRTAYALGLKNEYDYQKLLSQVVPKYLKANGFSIPNTEWVAFHHINTDNPHCHINFWERVPAQERGVMKEGFELEFKKLVAKELNLHHQTTHFFELIDEIEKDIRDQVEGVEVKDDDIYFNLIVDLAEKLPRKGRIQYNAKNCADLKSDVDTITTHLLNTQFKKEYKQFKDTTQAIHEYEKRLYGELIHNTERKEHELYERVGNHILQVAQQLIEEECLVELVTRLQSNTLFKNVEFNREQKQEQVIGLLKKCDMSSDEIEKRVDEIFNLSKEEKEQLPKMIEQSKSFDFKKLEALKTQSRKDEQFYQAKMTKER